MIIDNFSYDRKVLLSKIRIWKVLFFVCLCSCFMINKENKDQKAPQKNYIAHLDIDTVIYSNPEINKELENLIKDDKAKALILKINSPGGSPSASEELYYLIRDIGKKIPVIAVFDNLATSGAYLVSLAAERIISRNTTITGSIGVILQSYEITELAEALGIKLKSFKSGELKATPNPYEKVTENIERGQMFVVSSIYDFFLNLVIERRNLPEEAARQVCNGSIYTGIQAKKSGLIDDVGSYTDAVKWLEDTKGLEKNLEIKNIISKSEKYDFFGFKSKIFDILNAYAKPMLML